MEQLRDGTGKGYLAGVTKDNRLRVFAAIEPIMHVLAEDGRAWTLPFKQTAANDSNDNIVFHFKNTSDTSFDIHKIQVSSASAGLWTIETGRAYSSGGAEITLRQLNSGSSKTQDISSNFGTALVLTGTASDVIYSMSSANDPKDILADTEALQLEAGDTFAIKFKADTGNQDMAVTVYLHGQEPWEE